MTAAHKTATLNSDEATEFERARSALQVFNADDRRTWVYRGMEFKSEFGDAAFDAWDEWSSLSKSYGAKDARAAWKSFKNRPGGRTINSLFHDARQAGWRDSTQYKQPSREELERRAAERAKRDAEAAVQEAAARAAAAERAQKIWKAAEPKPDTPPVTHKYLIDKGVRAHGVRVGDWPFEVVDWETGEVFTRVVKNCLLVPVRDRKGKLHSLQSINTNGNKVHLTDGAKQGHFFGIGTQQKDEAGNPIYILAEGFATAASVHEATKQLALCCFDAGNVVVVAKALRQAKPDAVIVIAADNDVETLGNPGLSAAREAAEATGALMVVPVLTGMPEKKCDFNDLHAIEGSAAVAACIEDALSIKHVVLAPTHEEALGVAYARDCLARLEAEVAKQEGCASNARPPRELIIPHDGEIQRAAELARKLFPDAALTILAAPGDAAEAQRVAGLCGAVVDLPPIESEWRGWGEWALDTLFARIGVVAGSAPVARELAEQALEQAAAQVVVESQADAQGQPEVSALKDMDPQLRVNASPALGLDSSLMPVAGGHVVLDRETRAEVGGLGIIPLGTLGRSYMFWRKDTGTVELVSDNAVGTDASIMRLAPRQSWEMWCTGNAPGGNRDAFNRAAITNMLIQISKRIGRASTDFVPPDVASPEKVQRAFIEALLCAQPSAGLVAQALFVHPSWKKAEVWYDGFRGEVMITNVPPCGGPRGVWDESHDSLLSSWVSMQWGVTCTANMSAEAVVALARQDDRHPVRDYLSGLVWDGKKRLDTWLVDHAGAPDNAYTRAVGAKTLIAAVVRVMKPGCKHDTMLVLEGEQGLRKSSLIEAMLPNLAWHTDSLGEKVGHKDSRAGLQGKWVIEIGELANLHGAQVETVKQFLSDASDHYRPSYGRRAKDFPRQCIFIGTINPQGDGAYLHDATGGRRFWPVECTKADVERMRAERDQLWAEAMQRYKDGSIWWLTKEEDALATQEQGARQEENPWVPRIARYIDFIPPADKSFPWGGRRLDELKYILTSEVFEAFVGRAYLGNDLKDGKKIADALRSLGWESKNQPIVKGGRNIRHWRRVKLAEDDGPL